jgi:serine/threonine protein phosphatase PrpC
LETPNKHR